MLPTSRLSPPDPSKRCASGLDEKTVIAFPAGWFGWKSQYLTWTLHRLFLSQGEEGEGSSRSVFQTFPSLTVPAATLSLSRTFCCLWKRDTNSTRSSPYPVKFIRKIKNRVEILTTLFLTQSSKL